MAHRHQFPFGQRLPGLVGERHTRDKQGEALLLRYRDAGFVRWGRCRVSRRAMPLQHPQSGRSGTADVGLQPLVAVRKQGVAVGV